VLTLGREIGTDLQGVEEKSTLMESGTVEHSGGAN